MAEYGAKIQTIVSPLRIFLSLKFYPTLCGNAHENIGADAFSLLSLKAKRRSRKALSGIFGARRGENFALSL